MDEVCNVSSAIMAILLVLEMLEYVRKASAFSVLLLPHTV